jgi:hypothetical protein
MKTVELLELMFSVQSVPRLYNENQMDKGMCMFKTELKSWPWVSRKLKPGMTVLAKASSNSTDRKPLSLESTVENQF